MSVIKFDTWGQSKYSRVSCPNHIPKYMLNWGWLAEENISGKGVKNEGDWKLSGKAMARSERDLQ